MKVTASEINFVKDVARDILGQEITVKEAEAAYNTVKEAINLESADFYYELKNYFAN